MTHQVEVKDTISNGKPYKAYYINGIFPLDDNRIFLGVSGICEHMPNMCHLSFTKYRNNPEMPDMMVSTNDVDTAIQFYGNIVARLSDEYLEASEWEVKNSLNG